MAFPSKTIENFVRAGYPILYLVSWEEERVENSVRPVCFLYSFFLLPLKYSRRLKETSRKALVLSLELSIGVSRNIISSTSTRVGVSRGGSSS